MAIHTAKLVITNGKSVKRVIPESSSDEDIPTAKRSKSTDQPVTNTETDSDSDDEPIAARVNPSQPSCLQNQGSDSEDDVPLVNAKTIHNTKPADSSKKRGRPSTGSIDGSSSVTTLTTNSDSNQAPKPAPPHAEVESELSDDDVPIQKEPIKQVKLPKIKKLNSTRIVPPRRASITKAKTSRPQDLDSSDDDKPLAKKTPAKKPRISASKTTKPQIQSSDEDEEKPLMKKKPRISAKKAAKPKSQSSDEDDNKPLANMKPIKAKAKANPKNTASAATSADVKPKKGSKAAKKGEEEEKAAGSDEEAEDEEYKWWEQTKDDDTKKWDTLHHNGVLFPPEYVPLPKHVKMKYDGKSVDLPPESEEVAGFFGAMLNSDHCQKPTFCQNFFNDFKEVLQSHPPRNGTKILEFEKCDFTPILEYYDAERERKKGLSKEEKLKLKKEKEELEKQFQYCTLDGRQEKVGNFRVEPPSLFRGRGEHPKTGRLKKRIRAEDITINCSQDGPRPVPPPGHEWGSVVHLDKASWLAMWKENINGAFKYVFLAPGSSLKGQSDMKKFEKARLLKDHIERIRADYRAQLSDKAMAIRQRATAMYLIDQLALRAGNEKGDDEADTVGCCSLRFEHLTLEPPHTVTFDFLGKDSIRFFNTVQVDKSVFDNLRIFKKAPKTVGDMIFDRLTTSSLNKHLSDYMPGLTAKVFRTYNASFTFERELEKNMKELVKPTLAEKIYVYNKANREVAVLCNHQKSVSKGHDASMEKAYDKIKAMKYQRRRLRYQLLKASDYNKKEHKKFNQDESDLDDEWMGNHEIDLGLKEQEKVTKKFEKDNAALEKDGKPLLKASDLKARLKDVENFAAILKKERKDKNVEPAKARPADQIVAAIEKLDARIEAAKTSCKDRDEGKETSLGTSKMNYIDPRLTYAWCQRNEVPVERMFTKTLREKFTWAAATPADWKF